MWVGWLGDFFPFYFHCLLAGVLCTCTFMRMVYMFIYCTYMYMYMYMYK